MSPQPKHASGVVIKGRPDYLFGGELQYFRIPPSQWPDRILKCRRAFFNGLSSYFAWNWHEPEEGKFRFSGAQDIRRWLDLIEASGLALVARAGPYICAEWDFGGFPNWLVPKSCRMRSEDPAFLAYCRTWLKRLNRILLPHLAGRGGNVILYQVENEYWWDNMPYLNALKDMARADGIDVPIITNDCRHSRGSGIMDTLNIYPAVWDVATVERRIRELVAKQPDHPAVGIEFQCGGGYTVFGNRLPGFAGHVPERWTDIVTKTAIGCGLNGINYYMYHGGTNPGYWTAMHIGTSYDSDAAIKEWGELSERYYVTRLLGGFAESFGRDLVKTQSRADICASDDRKVEVLARTDGKTAFLFPRNLTPCDRKTHLTLAMPGRRKLRIPERGRFVQHAYSMSALPVNVDIGPGCILKYTTSEVFNLVRNPGENILILHQRAGYRGETRVRFRGRVEAKAGIRVRKSGGDFVLNYAHGPDTGFLYLAGRTSLKILVVSTGTAQKTWMATWAGRTLPVLSNIYFLRSWSEENRRLVLQTELRTGQPARLECLLPEEPEVVLVDGRPTAYRYDRAARILKLELDASAAPDMHIDLSGNWKTRAAAPETEPGFDDRSWLDFKPWQPAEAHGFLKNGYLWYRTTFRQESMPDRLRLTLTGFYDEAAVYVNGRFAGDGNNVLETDIAPFCKRGTNTLAVMLECLGHHHGGFRIPNGIVCPVYLSANPARIPLENWRRTFSSGALSEADILKGRPEASAEFDDSVWEPLVVRQNYDSRFTSDREETSVCWYRTSVDVPAEFRSKHLSLEFGSVTSEAFVFVNGVFAGRWFGKDFVGIGPYELDAFACEITDLVQPGASNTIAVAVLHKDTFRTRTGLHNYVRLSAYDRKLDRGWKIKQGLHGEEQQWHQPEFDDSDWSERAAPQPEAGHPGGLLWCRRAFRFRWNPDFETPMRLTLRHAQRKALIYFNGVLAGRYADIGPQEDFYIPEDWIREENTVCIMLDGRDKGPRLGEVSFSSYLALRKTTIDVRFK